MERKPLERRLIGGLLILLVLEASLLAIHLTWGGFTTKSQTSNSEIAGEVAKNENELHRRSLNSLLWEKSSTNSTLFYYDSVLTLAQSTATLKLFKDTEVSLSENTLVTIEPQDDKKYGEIRLKFHRGSFRARNPFAAARVHHEGGAAVDTWTMDIKTGSEIDLRQVGDKDFELSVQAGEVNFKSNNGEKRVDSNQILRIQSGQTIELQAASQEVWLDPPPRRIYTHDATASVPLKWQGMSGSLVVQTLNAQETSRRLNEDEFAHSLQLPIGHHRIYIRDEERSSSAINVEVWPAPLIHLISPLPRNRVQTKSPTAFIWTWPPGIASFVLHFDSKDKSLQLPLTENAFNTNFSEESDALWSVWGRDADDFLIPPPYSYPIFIRERPLSAPQIKGPTIRKPASKDKMKTQPLRGASFWLQLQQLLLPQAVAEESMNYQALLSWLPVVDADHYVIEISESADFRTLLITRKVIATEFLWQDIGQKAYYWRVAAGSKSGRLGFFSEPQVLEVKPAPAPLPVAPMEESVEKSVEKPEEPVPTVPLEFRKLRRMEWRPVYHAMRATNANSVNANLRGSAYLSVGYSSSHIIDSERMVRVSVDLTHFNYQPFPKKDYPFQQNLKWNEGYVSAMAHKKGRRWGRGFVVKKSAQFVRKDLEALEVKDAYSGGPALEGVWRGRTAEYVAIFSALLGSEIGINTRQRWYSPLSKDGLLIWGLGFDASVLQHKDGTTNSLSGQISLGFEF